MLRGVAALPDPNSHRRGSPGMFANTAVFRIRRFRRSFGSNARNSKNVPNFTGEEVNFLTPNQLRDETRHLNAEKRYIDIALQEHDRGFSPSSYGISPPIQHSSTVSIRSLATQKVRQCLV
jgi:hypothetical protein